MKCYCHLRNTQDLVWWEDSIRKVIRRTISWPGLSRGRIKYPHSSDKELSRLHQFGPEVLSNVFLGYALHAGRILERRHLDRRHWGLGTYGRIWNLWQRLNAKEVLSYEWWKVHFSGRRWNNQHFWRRSDSENILLNPGSSRRGEEQGNLRGESDEFSSTPLWHSLWRDAEARDDFRSISDKFIWRRHVEPSVKLHVLREESFPIPLKYQRYQDYVHKFRGNCNFHVSSINKKWKYEWRGTRKPVAWTSTKPKT